MSSQGKTAGIIIGLLLAGAGVFWAGINYQVAQNESSLDTSITSMDKSSATSPSTPTTGVLPQTLPKAAVVNGPSQAQFEQLAKQITLLQREVTALKKQQDRAAYANPTTVDDNSSTTDANVTVQDPALLAMQHQQEKQLAEQAVHTRTQRLDQAVYAGQVDETRQSTLQQHVQQALATADLAQQVSISAANCSNSICKLELQGKPKNGTDLTLLLYQKRVFPSGSKVLTVPNANGSLTIYAGVDGQPLPH